MSLGETVAVQAFADPAAALSACAEQRPDLVVASAEMAQLETGAFVAQLHDEARCGEVPVIVIAEFDERAAIDHALEAGAADHLVSPVDHWEFRARAQNLLALHRDQQAAREETASRSEERRV